MNIKLSGHLKRALPTIPESDDYLDLDLSNCHVEPPVHGRRVFDTKEILSKNIRKRLVSLILPDCFEEIQCNMDYVDLPILQKISGKNIINISKYAFNCCRTLTSIDFPKVTSVGDYAFESCKSLKSVDLPNVKNLEKYVFAYCTSLESINLPKIKSIGKSTFFYCTSLKSINIPNVTNIYDYAFGACYLLESIDLRWIHEVNETVFERCNSLEKVNLFMDLIDECMPEICNELYD